MIQGWTKWFSGAALGAGAMYLCDPDRGKRRRAFGRDKFQHFAVKASDAIDMTIHDAGNRLQGLQARARRLLWRRKKQPSDDTVKEHVRAQLGHVVSQAHFELTQENWTPTVRAITVLGGGTLGLYGVTRPTPAGMVAVIVGLSLLARGVSNKSLKRLLGIRGHGQIIHLDKAITINALPEVVFDLWSRYENFPHFMSHVEEARDLGEGRSHWVVSGPAGTRIEWDAVLTKWTRPEIIAWETEPDAAIQHAGTVHFEPMSGGTRVSVHMSYSPPAGALGHGLALLLGDDPKRQLDDDLMRMKAFIETGIPPHDAARLKRESAPPALH